MRKKIEKIKGFSLIEIIVVIGILSALIGVTGINFFQARNSALFEDGRASLINTLERAKGRAVSGVGDTKHGVRIESDRIIAFEGDDYIGIGEEILLAPLSTDQSGLNIIFDRISARPSTGTTIEITHSSGLTESIIITETGLILNP